MFSLALCLLQGLAPGASAPQPGHLSGVLELERGRATVVVEKAGVAAGARPVLLREGEETPVGSTGLLELGAGSRARLRWPGSLSGALEGPAVLEWAPTLEEGAPAGSQSFRFERLSSMELEVRTGSHTLHLPDGWRARMQSTAFHLTSLARGGFELKVHAGQPVAMEWRGDPSRARPPVLALAGEPVVFHLPEISAPDDTRAEHVWDVVSWPWAAPTATPTQWENARLLTERLAVHSRGAAAWPDPVPGGWAGEERSLDGPASGEAGAERLATELPEWLRAGRGPLVLPDTITPRGPSSSGPVADSGAGPDGPNPGDVDREAYRKPGEELGPEQSATAPTPIATRGPVASEGVVPEVVVTEVQDPDSVEDPESSGPRWLQAGEGPPVAAEDYRAEEWRSVPLEQLQRAGKLIIQAAPGVTIQHERSGGVKVLVGADAPESIWIFAEQQDLRLERGTVVRFHPDGRRRSTIGKVELLGPQPGRPLRTRP